MHPLRTNQTQALYDKHKQERRDQNLTDCELCSKEHLQDFDHWAIVPNMFPYDLIATRSEMLIPLRHTNETDLTQEEKAELEQIKHENLAQIYDITIETFARNRTIPEHFHLHLLVCKDSYSELGTA